jgi:hypothetical protein
MSNSKFKITSIPNNISGPQTKKKNKDIAEPSANCPKTRTNGVKNLGNSVSHQSTTSA